MIAKKRFIIVVQHLSDSLNISKAEVGRVLDISPQAINSLVNSDVEPLAKHLAMLVKTYGVNGAYFLDENETEMFKPEATTKQPRLDAVMMNLRKEFGAGDIPEGHRLVIMRDL